LFIIKISGIAIKIKIIIFKSINFIFSVKNTSFFQIFFLKLYHFVRVLKERFVRILGKLFWRKYNMVEKMIKELFSKIYQFGFIPILRVSWNMIKKYFKGNPHVLIGLILGFIIGNWIGGFFLWIPLLGALLHLIFIILFMIAGAVISNKIKKGVNNEKK
jgi:hypothetical protein